MTNDSAIADLRHPDAEQLLRSPDPARLAYDGRDGFPRVIPIGFLWNGSAIVVCAAPTAPKVKALVVPELNLGQMVREVERAAAGECRVLHVPHAGGGVHRPEEILNAIVEASR